MKQAMTINIHTNVKRKRGWKAAAAALAASLMLASCQTVQTTQAGVVGIDRKQTMAVSAAAMEQSANKQYAQLMAEADKKGKLNADTGQYARVKGIADKLIRQTTAFRPDALHWKWEVNVLTSPEVNAWCMPGGKIAVYTGLIDKLKITDDELAAVMGHEISHALREHSRERASEQAVAGIGISILATVAGVADQDYNCPFCQAPPPGGGILQHRAFECPAIYARQLGEPCPGFDSAGFKDPAAWVGPNITSATAERWKAYIAKHNLLRSRMELNHNVSAFSSVAEPSSAARTLATSGGKGGRPK